MKRVLMIGLLLFYFGHRVEAQKTVDAEKNNRSFQIGLSGGIKYFIHNPYDQLNKKTSFAFTFEVAKDFWNTGKHFIGLEMIGYNYLYEHSPIYSKKFQYAINILYKRQSNIYNNIGFEVNIGLSILSNEEWGMLGPALNIKIKYAITNIDIFIKNSFRWGFLFYNQLPWILTAGISIKI